MSKKLKITNYCRTCAKNLNPDELIPLFPNGAIIDIQKYQNLRFQVRQDDGLPQQICGECLDQFNEMNEFIQKCENKQLFLEKKFNIIKKDIQNLNENTSNNVKTEENLIIEELLDEYDYENDAINEDFKIEILTDDKSMEMENKDEELNDHNYVQIDEFNEESIDNIKSELYDEMDVAKELEKAIRLAHENELEKKNFDSNKMVKLEGQGIDYQYDDVDENIKSIPSDSSTDIFDDLSCEYCPEKNMTFYQLQEHIKYKHKRRPRSRSVMCEICGLVVRKVNMKTHMNNHLGIPNETKNCEICGKTGLTIDQVKAHLYKHGTPKHHCEHCRKGFRNLKNLESHYESNPNKQCVENKTRKNRNGPKASLQCLYCMKKFLTTVSLVKHCQTHSKPDIKDAKHHCNYCGTVFKRADHLKIHVNSQHLKTEEFKCQLCDKICYASFRLNLHMRTRHLKIPPRPKCDYCDKTFSNPQCLRRHQLEKHSVDNLYRCPICNEEFSKHIDLKKHSKIHDSLVSNEIQKEMFLKEFCPNVLDNSRKKKKPKSDSEDIEIEELNYTIIEDE